MPSAPKVYRPQGQAARQDHRPAAHKRGYDHDWNRLSEAYKAEHPLCEDCLQENRTTPVDEVDHTVPIRVDPSRRLDRGNLRSLCKSHHRRKTKRDQLMYVRQSLERG